MEKTFVDHYLLDEYDVLVKGYNKLERLNAMNVFEKCLLIDSLIQTGNDVDAKRLAEHIRLSKDAAEYVDIEAQNKIFDIVLNLNMLKATDAESAAGGNGAPPTLPSGLSGLGGAATYFANFAGPS